MEISSLAHTHTILLQFDIKPKYHEFRMNVMYVARLPHPKYSTHLQFHLLTCQNIDKPKIKLMVNMENVIVFCKVKYKICNFT